MKNFFTCFGVFFSLSLTSCLSFDNKSQEVDPVSREPQEIKHGIVHRVFQRWTVFSVRLTDGKILVGFCRDMYDDNKEKKQIEDFFFAQPGDTIVYSGEKVLEVKFKD